MKSIISILLFTLVVLAFGQQLPPQEAIYIRDIEDLAKGLKKEYWPAWQTIPFAMLLVDEDYEYLINHPNATPFSNLSYYDSLLKQEVFYREQTLPLNLAATFPLIDATPVIVMGKISNSNFDAQRWAWTLLHEHFHQFQMSATDYYNASRSLDLAKDSTDHMWPLNYPFPYENEEVNMAVSKMCQLLLSFIIEEDPSLAKEYLEAKMELKKLVSPKDYTYFNFQIWQEGCSRFLEINLLDLKQQIQPSQNDQLLRASYLDEIKSVLEKPELTKRKRVVFYSLGAAEWMLIDQINPNWKDSYLNRMFETDYFLE